MGLRGGGAWLGPALLWACLASAWAQEAADWWTESLGQSGNFLSPCAYPTPGGESAAAYYEACRLSDPSARRFNVCDPRSAVSITEVGELVVALDRVALEGAGQSCVCGGAGEDGCWFRLGLAFLDRLPVPDTVLPPADAHKTCYANASQVLAGESVAGLGLEELAAAAGQGYAETLRRRWAPRDGCGEDLLVLFLMHRPRALRRLRPEEGRPMVWVSVGSVAESRLGLVEPSLEGVMEELNERLEIGVEFRAASVHLVGELGRRLAAGQRAWAGRRRKRKRGHVPLWAWGAFLGCGVLLAVLAVASWLLKGGTRAAAQKSSSTGQGGGDKKWKAGFVGGNDEWGGGGGGFGGGGSSGQMVQAHLLLRGTNNR